MKNAILTVGKPKAAYIAEGLAFYAGRLKPWGGCELMAAKGVRAKKSTPAAEVKEKEGVLTVPLKLAGLVQVTITCPE